MPSASSTGIFSCEAVITGISELKPPASNAISASALRPTYSSSKRSAVIASVPFDTFSFMMEGAPTPPTAITVASSLISWSGIKYTSPCSRNTRSVTMRPTRTSPPPPQARKAPPSAISATSFQVTFIFSSRPRP